MTIEQLNQANEIDRLIKELQLLSSGIRHAKTVEFNFQFVWFSKKNTQELSPERFPGPLTEEVKRACFQIIQRQIELLTEKMKGV
jgi:hypothetical protein